MPINKKAKPPSESSDENVKVEQFKFGRTNKKKQKRPVPKKKYPRDNLIKKSVWVRESLINIKPNDSSVGDFVNKCITSSMNKPEKIMTEKNLYTDQIK